MNNGDISPCGIFPYWYVCKLRGSGLTLSIKTLLKFSAFALTISRLNATDISLSISVLGGDHEIDIIKGSKKEVNFAVRN